MILKMGKLFTVQETVLGFFNAHIFISLLYGRCGLLLFCFKQILQTLSLV